MTAKKVTKANVYASVAKMADMDSIHVNAADSSRVCKCLFKVLANGILEKRFSTAEAIKFCIDEIENSKGEKF